MEEAKNKHVMALAGLVFSIPVVTQFMFTEIKVKYLQICALNYKHRG